VESFTSVANGVVYIGSNDNYIYAIGTITVQQPTSPLSTASPSPTVPEFPLLAVPLLLSILMAVAGLLIYHKRKGSLVTA
jgi:hypothetical protein